MIQINAKFFQKAVNLDSKDFNYERKRQLLKIRSNP